MLRDAALFLLGFYVLIKGAGYLVDGASAVARKLRMSEWLIGLTIVGIGTSIPEFAVTFFSNLTNAAPLGIGTIVGSNTANILFILGVAAIIFPFGLKQEWVRRDLPWNVGAVLAVIAVTYGADRVLGRDLAIDRFEGLILFALFAIWLAIAIKNGNREPDAGVETVRLMALPFSILMIAGGVVGVVFGGNWVVESASRIAASLGFSRAFIGLTIVGLGTSLPELVVTFTAALRKHSAMAIGNIIGSNVFDFLFILGMTAMVRPMPFPSAMGFDIMVTALAAVMLLAAARIGRKYVLERWQGAVLAIAYVAYLIFLFIREGTR